MRREFITGLFLIAVGLAIPSARADLLVNGGFENQPNYGSGVINAPGFSAFTGGQIPGWTIEPGHAVTIHDNTIYPTISGTYSVNADGEGFNGQNVNLYQDFASTDGVSYALAFDWQGWANGTSAQLHISLTDTVTASVVVNGLYSWDPILHHVETPFLGTGNLLRLRIQESPQSGFNDNTYMVDNFSVTSVPSVPEPASLTLLGVAMLAFLRRPTPNR